MQYGAKSESDYDARILGQADRAVASLPDTVWAYYAKCVYLILGYSHRAKEQLGAVDAGLAINPNFAPLGNGSRSSAEIPRPLRTSESGCASNAVKPARSSHLAITCYLATQNLVSGISTPRARNTKGNRRGRQFPAVRGLAAVYALKDKKDEAKSALSEAQRFHNSRGLGGGK